MSKNLEVRISSRSDNGTQIWEGTVTLPGTRPTKLVRRSTNTTQFASRSALLTSARSFAKNVGYSTVSEPVAKKAAKKSNKTSVKKTSTPKQN
jgi:hypothetical protein